MDKEKAMDKMCQKTGCVIMASGSSTRFGGGKNKLLEDLGGRPLILHTAEAARNAGLSALIVTRSPLIAELCETEGCRFLLHEEPEKSATIRLGLKFLMEASLEGLAGCLFIPGDQPLISPKSLQGMIRTFFDEEEDKAVRLSWKGEAKSPVLFPESVFPDLLSLRGEAGGSTLLRHEGEDRNEEDRLKVLLFEAEKEAEVFDADTPEDLERIREEIAK